MNQHDAPPGFIAIKASPMHQCKGCFFDTRNAECPTHADGYDWCDC